MFSKGSSTLIKGLQYSGQNIHVHITGGSPQSPTTSVRGTLPRVRGMFAGFAGFAEPSRGL